MTSTQEIDFKDIFTSHELFGFKYPSQILEFDALKECTKGLLLDYFEDIMTIEEKVRFTDMAVIKELESSKTTEMFLTRLQQSIIRKVEMSSQDFNTLLREQSLKFLDRNQFERSSTSGITDKSLDFTYIRNYLRRKIGEDIQDTYNTFYKAQKGPEDTRLCTILCKILDLDRYLDTTNATNILSKVQFDFAELLKILFSTSSNTFLADNSGRLIKLNIKYINEFVLKLGGQHYDATRVTWNTLINDRDTIIDRVLMMYNSSPLGGEINAPAVFGMKIIQSSDEVKRELLNSIQQAFRHLKSRDYEIEGNQILDEKRKNLCSQTLYLKSNLQLLAHGYLNSRSYDDLIQTNDDMTIQSMLRNPSNEERDIIMSLAERKKTSLYNDPQVSRMYSDVLRGEFNPELIQHSPRNLNTLRKFSDFEKLTMAILGILGLSEKIFRDIDDLKEAKQQVLRGLVSHTVGGAIDHLTRKFYLDTDIFEVIDILFEELRDCVAHRKIAIPGLDRDRLQAEMFRTELEASRKRKDQKSLNYSLETLSKKSGLVINRLVHEIGKTTYDPYNVERCLLNFYKRFNQESLHNFIPDKTVFYLINDEERDKAHFFKLYLFDASNADIGITVTEFVYLENYNSSNTNIDIIDEYRFDTDKLIGTPLGNVFFDFCKVEIRFEKEIEWYNLSSKLMLSIFQLILKENIMYDVKVEHLRELSPIMISNENLANFRQFMSLSQPLSYLSECLTRDISNPKSIWRNIEEENEAKRNSALNKETAQNMWGKIRQNTDAGVFYDMSVNKERARNLWGSVRDNQDTIINTAAAHKESALNSWSHIRDSKNSGALHEMSGKQEKAKSLWKKVSMASMDTESIQHLDSVLRELEENLKMAANEDAEETEENGHWLKIKENLSNLGVHNMHDKGHLWSRIKESMKMSTLNSSELDDISGKLMDFISSDKTKSKFDPKVAFKKLSDHFGGNKLNDQDLSSRQLEIIKEMEKQKAKEAERKLEIEARAGEAEERLKEEQERRKKEEEAKRQAQIDIIQKLEQEAKLRKEKEEILRKERETRLQEQRAAQLQKEAELKNQRDKERQERLERLEQEKKEREQLLEKEKKEREEREQQLRIEKEKREKEEKERLEKERIEREAKEEKERLAKEEREREIQLNIINSMKKKEQREKEEKEERERKEREKLEREEKERKEKEEKERKEKEEKERKEKEEKERKEKEEKERKEKEEKERKEKEEKEREIQLKIINSMKKKEQIEKEEKERKEREEEERRERERQENEKKEKEEKERIEKEKKEKEIQMNVINAFAKKDDNKKPPVDEFSDFDDEFDDFDDIDDIDDLSMKSKKKDKIDLDAIKKSGGFEDDSLSNFGDDFGVQGSADKDLDEHDEFASDLDEVGISGSVSVDKPENKKPQANNPKTGLKSTKLIGMDTIPLIDQYFEMVAPIEDEMIQQYLGTVQIDINHVTHILQEFMRGWMCYPFDYEDTLPLLESLTEILKAPIVRRPGMINKEAKKLAVTAREILIQAFQKDDFAKDVMLLIPLIPIETVDTKSIVLMMVNIEKKEVGIISLSEEIYDEGNFKGDQNVKALASLVYLFCCYVLDPECKADLFDAENASLVNINPEIAGFLVESTPEPGFRYFVLCYLLYFEGSGQDYSLASLIENIECQEQFTIEMAKRLFFTIDSIDKSEALIEGQESLFEYINGVTTQYNQTGECMIAAYSNDPEIEETIPQICDNITKFLSPLKSAIANKISAFFGISINIASSHYLCILHTSASSSFSLSFLPCAAELSSALSSHISSIFGSFLGGAESRYHEWLRSTLTSDMLDLVVCQLAQLTLEQG